MRKRIFILLITILSISACSLEKNIQTQISPVIIEPVVVTPEPDEIKYPYTVYIEEKDYELSLYEPKQGCYLGAYILSNKIVDSDISQFEDLTEKKHSIYMYNVKLGDNLPITWLLSCISQMKTPCIMVQPDSDNLAYDEAKLIAMAKSVSEFYVPMFVQFAPVDNNYNPLHYVEYYRKAREIFRTYASNAAFVWNVDISDVFDCVKYYPGNEYVDWVGVSCYKTLNNENAFDEDIFKGIDFFYNYFQKDKPIMISELAISHLNNINYVYKTTQAALEITRIYSDILSEYPRIKAVIYMDFNGMNNISTKKYVRDNFSVSEEENILRAYKSSILPEKYLSECDLSSFGDIYPELMKSPFEAYKIGNEIFISDKCVAHDLNLDDIIPYLTAKYINNQIYFNLKELEKYSLEIEIDSSKATIIIK